jgi:hypothetical protein
MLCRVRAGALPCLALLVLLQGNARQGLHPRLGVTVPVPSLAPNHSCHVPHGAPQIVQQQLSDAEKVDKQDDSPVTVADYGGLTLKGLMCEDGTRPQRLADRPGAALLPPARGLAGAQVLVAWALSRVDPDTRLSMVAEEDSASLKCAHLMGSIRLPPEAKAARRP